MISERSIASECGPSVLVVAVQSRQKASHVCERVLRVDRDRQVEMRRPVAQHEGHGLALGQGELRHRLEVLAADVGRAAQHHHVGAGDGAHRAVLQPRHPRRGRAVAEAQHQLHAHRDLAFVAAHDAHQVGRGAARQHEVDHGRLAAIGLERGLEDQRVLAVAAARRLDLVVRRDQPEAVALAAQQLGEAGIRIEARPAQPVDRAVEADQRRRLAVADHAVAFDRRGHVGLGELQHDLDVLRPSLERLAASASSGTWRVISRDSHCRRPWRAPRRPARSAALLALTEPNVTTLPSTALRLKVPKSKGSGWPLLDTPVRQTMPSTAARFMTSAITVSAPVHSMTMSGLEVVRPACARGRCRRGRAPARAWARSRPGRARGSSWPRCRAISAASSPTGPPPVTRRTVLGDQLLVRWPMRSMWSHALARMVAGSSSTPSRPSAGSTFTA